MRFDGAGTLICLGTAAKTPLAKHTCAILQQQPRKPRVSVHFYLLRSSTERFYTLPLAI